MTFTVQTPQLPFPPHAEGTKSLLADRVLSNVPPAAVRSALAVSSLMTIVTSPVDTSSCRATINTTTRETMTTVNISTPRPISTIVLEPFPHLQLHAAKRHESNCHQTRQDERDTQTT